MENSILESIKKLVGVGEEDPSFDTDILFNINMAFTTLDQLGVGTPNFRISDESSTWDEFIPVSKQLEMVKTYIYMKVKLAFDPPANKTVLQGFQDQIREYEWRLNVQVDPADKEENQNG